MINMIHMTHSKASTLQLHKVRGSKLGSRFPNFQSPSSKVPGRFHTARFQKGSRKVPAIFRKVLARFKQGPTRFQQGFSKVPASLQDCSKFSGRAFSCQHSLATEIETQQIRCWESQSGEIEELVLVQKMIRHPRVDKALELESLDGSVARKKAGGRRQEDI